MRHAPTTGRAHARPLLRATLAVLLAAALLPGSGCGSRHSSIQEVAAPKAMGAIVGDVSLAMDPHSSDLMMSWVAGDTTALTAWFARSSDQGRTWSEPLAVTPPGTSLRLHPQSSPMLIADDNRRVGLLWNTSIEVEGRRWPASDLYFSRSLDGGASWSAPVPVSDDSLRATGSRHFGSVALLPNGALMAAWLDSRPGAAGVSAHDTTEGNDAAVYLARSQDFGGHWSANIPQWGDVCPCCRVAIDADLQGFPFVAFRKHFPGQLRDIVVARPDGPPVRAFDDRWPVAGCPHAGPALQISHDGTMRLAWYTGAESRAGVWFRHAMPGDFDSTVTPIPIVVGPRVPTAHVVLGDAGMRGTVLAVDADSTGARRLTLARVDAAGRGVRERFVVPGTEGVANPRLTALNHRTDAYVAWVDSRDDGPARLRVLRWQVGR